MNARTAAIEAWIAAHPNGGPVAKVRPLTKYGHLAAPTDPAERERDARRCRLEAEGRRKFKATLLPRREIPNV